MEDRRGHWRYLKKFRFSGWCCCCSIRRPGHQRQKNKVQTYQCGRRLHVPSHEHSQDSAREWSGAATPGSLAPSPFALGSFGPLSFFCSEATHIVFRVPPSSGS